MAEVSLNGGSWHLKIPAGIYQKLHAHLFPGDHDEHGAVIAAGIAHGPDGRVVLLARELFLARDGVDYIPGKRGHRMLRAEFIQRRIRQCREERVAYLAIHNHGGVDSVQFSDVDMRSHERGYPALLDILGGLPVGALVFASHAIAGDIWLPDGSRVPIASAEIIGRRRAILTPAPVSTLGRKDETYDRQARLFGDAGQDILRRARVGIVGLGGVGSLLAEYLALLGVGHFVLIDPDRIVRSNLPRVVGASRWDARTWLTSSPWPLWVRRLAERTATFKTKIARRVIRRANRAAIVETFEKDMQEPAAAARLLSCDYIFLAADSMSARLLFNAIVHQYLVPGVQIGSKVTVDTNDGAVTNVHVAVRPVTPESGCLWCNRLINPAKLQEEGQTERERDAQRYIDDPDVAAPSVVTLNAIGAAQAANDFLFYMTGLMQPEAKSSYMRFNPQRREVVFDNPRPSPECSECGVVAGSRLAKGKIGAALPVFFRS